MLSIGFVLVMEILVIRGRNVGSVDVHLSHNTVLANEMNAVKLVSVLQ